MSLRTFLAVVLAVAAACGGKSRVEGTTPGEGDDGADPTVGWLGGEVAGKGKPRGTAGVSPSLRPPPLDLTPAQQKYRVDLNLKKGRTALAGRPPDPDAAIQAAQAALQADETSVDAMVLLAHANLVKGFDDQAEDILDKAKERGGDKHKQALFVQGLIYDRTERPDKARAAYEAAVRLDPKYASALMNLGVHYLRNKRWAEAVQVYELLSGELAYRTPAVWTNLGSAYRGRSIDFSASDVARRNDLLLKAEASYKKALGAGYANAYYDLGLLFLDADPYPEGQGDMDRIKRLQRARTYFDEYRARPGADQRLADEQVGVVQKLVVREEQNRKKAAERAAKKAAKDAADKRRDDKKKDGKSDGKTDEEGFQ